MSNRQLEIDHKWPVSRFGGNELANLQLLCTACKLRKGIQTDEEFRDRYWRLLPPAGEIPDPPIPQDWFTQETQRTRSSRTVRGIYRNRFENARRQRRQAEWDYDDGEFEAPQIHPTFGILAVVVIATLLVLAVTSQCAG